MEHSIWLYSLLKYLNRIGDEGQIAAEYLRNHRTKIAFKLNKPSIGAWWTIFRNINLNSHYYSYDKSLNNTRVLTLIIHEVRHLQQGIFTALSVYGELDAWQLEWSLYYRKHGKYPHAAIEELMRLPLGWDRSVLRRAVKLMQAYTTKEYRVDLLPLYPLWKELSYWLFRRVPQTQL